MVDNILRSRDGRQPATAAGKAPELGDRLTGSPMGFSLRHGLRLGRADRCHGNSGPCLSQTNNLLNLLRQWAPPGLMAVGMTFVIISGGFDLSVGGTYAAAAVLSARLAASMPIPVAIAASVLMGAGIGLVNGAVITRLEVNPFVATLGMGFIVTGLTEVISNAMPMMVEDPAFQIFGGGDLLGHYRSRGSSSSSPCLSAASCSRGASTDAMSTPSAEATRQAA